MKKYVAKKDKYTNNESEFVDGKWETKYFYLFCDICGVRHPTVCVNDFGLGKRFATSDICYECQKDLYHEKDRKCRQCSNKFKDFRKVVKLFFLNKAYYFCNHKCYYS